MNSWDFRIYDMMIGAMPRVWRCRSSGPAWRRHGRCCGRGGWCVSAVGISHVPANGLRMQVGTPVVDGAGYRLAEEGAECLAQHVRLLEPMPVTALIQEAEAGLR
jgi:hypothetical protein